MRLKWLPVLGIALLVAQGCERPPAIKTQTQMVSYAIGVDLARNSKLQGFAVDVDLVTQGLKDGIKGKKLLVPETDLRKTMIAFQTEMRRKQAMVDAIATQDNKNKGEAFLTENKTKEGVIVQPSGLQYKILKKGDGRKPTEADTVVCHFRGMLIDGTELDNSYGSSRPATFRVKGTAIPGWTEALQLMPVGSKWQLFIPPHLAYGERRVDSRIGPNATLIFELELIAIK